MVKKIRRYLYSFWRNSRTWRTDGQTDGRTPGDGIYRAYAYASRGKNVSDKLHFGDKQNNQIVKPQIQKFSALKN